MKAIKYCLETLNINIVRKLVRASDLRLISSNVTHLIHYQLLLCSVCYIPIVWPISVNSAILSKTIVCRANSSVLHLCSCVQSRWWCVPSRLVQI